MFSTTELKTLQLLSEGQTKLTNIAAALHKSPQQVYRLSHHLEEEGLVQLSRGHIIPEKSSFLNMLLRLLTQYPHLSNFLARSGLSFLAACRVPSTLNEIMRQSGLSQSALYIKLKQAKKSQIIIKNKNIYTLNEKFWPELKLLAQEFQLRQQTIDSRTPPDAFIYRKSKSEIIFSSQQDVKAVKTAFSAYEYYGIKILTPRIYYYLPEKKPSLREVFLHSLYVAEAEPSIRNLTYVAVFYSKFADQLNRITSPILINLKDILHGKSIKRYPTLDEIKEK